MTIRTKLKLGFLAMLGLPLVIGILFYAMYRDTECSARKEAAALRIITGTYELNTVTHSYAASRTEARRLQALLRRTSLGALLKEGEFASAGEKEIIQSLLSNNESMKNLQDRILINTVNMTSVPPTERGLLAETNEWLLARSRGKTLEMVSEARRLWTLSEREIRSTHKRFAAAAVSLIALSVIALGVLSAFLYKGAAGALEELRRGTERLAAGDLTYRVDIGSKDETGRLADAFNRMAGEIKSSYVALEREVEERKRAEEGLRQVQRMLESRVEGRTAHLVELLEQLRGSELKHRIVVENSSDMGYWISPEGDLVYVSPSCKRITGYGSEEFSRDPSLIRKIVYPEDLAVFDRHRQEAEVEEEANPKEVQFRIVHADGAIRWMGHVCRHVVGEGGRFLGIRAANRDVTEQKLAQEALRKSEERFRHYFELGLIGMGIASPTEGILEANDELCRMLGYERGELLEKNWAEFTHPDDLPSNITLFKRAMAGEIEGFEFDKRLIRKDGQAIDVSTSVRALRRADGSVDYFIALLQDVTERNRMENELRKSRDELEVRVRQRTAELERKNEELQSFAFVASHDLNEPLRKIQAFGDLLEKRGAVLGEQERDFISRMNGAAGRMQELLDALLRYSRLHSKGQEFRPTKLDVIVQDAVSDLEVAIGKVGAHVEIGPLPSISGDPNQLRQLFQNLIANSLKYHRSGVKPFVRIHGEEEEGTCRLFVEDHGIGFDEKYLDKIFQPFQRLHGRSEYPGTGMGLAICRKIVERHHGTITAKSTPGRGSIFIVTLPVKR